MKGPNRTRMCHQPPITRSSHACCLVRLTSHARHHGERSRRGHTFIGDPQKDPDQPQFIYHIDRSGGASHPSGVLVMALVTRTTPEAYRATINCSLNPRHRPACAPSRIAIDPASPAGQQEQGADQITPESARDASSASRKIPSTTRELVRVVPRRHPTPSLGSRLRTHLDEVTRISFSTPRKAQGEHYRSQLKRTSCRRVVRDDSCPTTFGAGTDGTVSLTGEDPP